MNEWSERKGYTMICDKESRNESYFTCLPYENFDQIRRKKHKKIDWPFSAFMALSFLFLLIAQNYVTFFGSGKHGRREGGLWIVLMAFKQR